VTVWPRKARLIIGKVVEISTKIIMPSRTQLLSRKKNSRLSSDWISCSAFSFGSRQMISAVQPTIKKPMYQTKYWPMSEREKACTEAMAPERVRNVPKIVMKNVRHMRKTFQTRSRA